jgi:hypothetical protein
MIDLSRRVLLASILTTLLVLAIVAGGARRASAQITGLAVDNSGSSGSFSIGTGENVCTTSVLGTVAPLGGNIGESRNIAHVTASTPTSFTTRFIADLCTDSGGNTLTNILTFKCDSPGENSQSLTANPIVTFGVKAPSGTNYRLTVTNTIAGEVDINNDGGGAATGTMSAVTTTETGAAQLGPGSLNLTSGLPIYYLSSGTAAFGQTATVVYTGVGTGASSPQQIASAWTAACSSPSNGQECGIRIGLPCSITGGAALPLPPGWDTAFTVTGNDTTFGPGGLYPGTPSRDQTQDGQFVSVGLEFCGDGIVQNDASLHEICDQGLDPVTGNGGTNSCCTTDCRIKSNGTMCRPLAGECDVAESCDGVSPLCPADAKRASGTSCTDDGNPCTVDLCDGTDVFCQHRAGNAGTLCRDTAGECDVAELCDGSSINCPPDTKQPFGTACTDDGNVCTTDICNGTSALCQHPAGHAGTLCRASAGECDAAACDGSSPNCPPPGTVKPAGTACGDDGNVCTADVCNGTSTVCQHPAGNAGTVCRHGSGDVCDPDETCTGTSTTCPADVVRTSSFVCRATGAACNIAETCTGVPGQPCPPDTNCSATPTPTALIPGGLQRNDCVHEWLVAGAAATTNRVRCMDDDPACDFGSAPGDNTCTFHVASCFNNTNEASACKPSDVRQVNMLRPGLKPPAPVDAANRSALETALQGLGARLQGTCVNPAGRLFSACSANSDCDSTSGRGDGWCRRIAAFAPPLTAVDQCTPFADIRVPLGQTVGRLSRRTKVLELVARPSSGPADADSLMLECLPKRPITPTPTNIGSPTSTVTPIPTITPTSVSTPTSTSAATDTPAAINTPTGTNTRTSPPTPTKPTSTPSPTVTPTFVSQTCTFASTTGVTISSPLAVMTVALTGSQTWQFGYLKPDDTRDMLIPPSGSHFDCASTALMGENVRVCARLDPTAGGSGQIDCAGGDITSGYNNVVQLDHNTNQSTVGGQPNIGLPFDPNCTNTFSTRAGEVLTSCAEGYDAACSGTANVHLGACNSPVEQTFSGAYPTGGFSINEKINLGMAIGDCSTPCPSDDTPLQAGELQIAGVLTSGQSKGVLWNVNDTALIMGTTGAGDGVKICGSVTGGPNCATTAIGSPFGDCVAAPPTSMASAQSAIVFPFIDPPFESPEFGGDFMMTLRLTCQSDGRARGARGDVGNRKLDDLLRDIVGAVRA